MAIVSMIAIPCPPVLPILKMGRLELRALLKVPRPLVLAGI
jgi:hypothetical protein